MNRQHNNKAEGVSSSSRFYLHIWFFNNLRKKDSSFDMPHKCHYGACHPSRLPCAKEYQCGHTCKLRCHGPKPPPKPEFTPKPKKKKIIQQSEGVPGTPCPPCPELVWRSCADRMMVCSDKSQFSCENLCGNPLPCGNHYCTKTCHALDSQL
ncbi:NF-X1-type zinc finger protein NFXL2-like [Vigna radiata var. radiata]|uniref:NF-X1-type zinc finger protein NFXL2-like n=1 Tax=Vigna radiata var. radiata TaxID=3916 RepID=A0A3Q0ERS3_VIGRR|nr:NF-X1-type zinc finger protein NFXL2-like [Vigna radiata var. radiata]